jgi:hypothetical protein
MTDPDRTIDLEADDTADLPSDRPPKPPPVWERAKWRRGDLTTEPRPNDGQSTR